MWQEIDSWQGHKKPDPKYLVQGLAGPRYQPVVQPVEGLVAARFPQGKGPVPLVGASSPPAQGLVGAIPPPPVVGLVGARFPPAQGSGGPRFPPAQGLVGARFPPAQGLVGARPPPAQAVPLLPAAVTPLYEVNPLALRPAAV